MNGIWLLPEVRKCKSGSNLIEVTFNINVHEYSGIFRKVTFS